MEVNSLASKLFWDVGIGFAVLQYIAFHCKCAI